MKANVGLFTQKLTQFIYSDEFNYKSLHQLQNMKADAL